MRSLVLSLLSACTSVTPASSWLPPAAPPTPEELDIPVQGDEPAPPEVASDPPAAGDDQAGVAKEDTDAAPIEPGAPSASGDLSDDDLMAAMLGGAPPPDEATPAAPAVPPTSAPPARAEASTPPQAPPPAIDWGVRLVSTLPDTQPPRAILALGSGREVVVEPGTMLPEARLVVLAIGPEGIQVALVEPLGDRARVTTQTLQPLYGRAVRDRP